MTPFERFTDLLIWTVALAMALFLLTPLAVTVAVSFGSSAVFTLPPPGWSLRWYEQLANWRGLPTALRTSIEVAVLSTGIALLLGGMAALALVRGRIPGREAVVAFLVSPLMLPGIVLGIALLQGFRLAGLRHVWASLVLAHVIITLPYVVRTLYAALSRFDFVLVDAARTLGCSYGTAIRLVLVPNLAPAFLTAAIFAFLASMDNYAISIFFTDPWTKTLPIEMLNLVAEEPDPTIAAIASVLILLTLILLLLCDRAVGLQRIASQ